ncbi:MAG: hypothetical protein JKY30_13755, partial [Flavobacteriales bacterium]|nr:hypothetical protein [Flavobacteriales bacterium]
MKKLLLICSILFLGNPFFSQTYDLITVTNNGVNGVIETISGVAMTVITKNNGANNTSFLASAPVFGTNGVVFHGASSINTEEMIISFDAAVNVSSIRVISTQTHTRTWTFTPTGGSNSAVAETGTFATSTDVTLGFIGVTEITITSNFTGGLQEQMVFDQLTLAAACTDPDVPSVLSATPSTICTGSNSTLSWIGALNDATVWHVYTTSCGVTQLTTTTSNSLVVTPGANTTYFIRGEGGCVTPGSCGQVGVTVNTIPSTPTISAGGATTFCTGGSVTLTSSSASGN